MRFQRGRQGIGVLLSVLALALNYSPQARAIRDLPTELTLRQGQSHELNLGLPMAVNLDDGADDGAVLALSSTDETLERAQSVRIQAESEGSAKLNFSFLGMTLKAMDIKVQPERVIMPGGLAIGVALFTNGVLVVGTSEIGGAQGGSPAVAAGLRPGDLIQSVDDQPVLSAVDLTARVNAAAGRDVEVRFLRKEQPMRATIRPALDRLDGTYRLGIWVRDSTAGVGTLSFYDPATRMYAALGHAITDADTGTNLTVRQGRVLFSRIVDIQKGQRGQPGELRGSFDKDEMNQFGDIRRNNDFGVSGSSDIAIVNPLYPKGLPVGSQATARVGPASILTTLDDTGVKEYAIEITKVSHQSEPAPKSMTLLVTDPELLERTGGIVQGMSGSPIIQDGHIIGAVTHVYVNDPTQGYGLFIEWMLDQTDDL
ncbi:MAG: SpoIVB peptidase [Oscillospiraceae bacterium]|nr:SpoIVB peptidase [Oscillospiraceae bacterium]